MRTREGAVDRFVNLSEITEIELVILKRMRTITSGEHRSQAHGAGFDFLGLRDWQAGDRFSSIDWGQSTLNNFMPLVVREYEQPSNANVTVVADASLSTRCGIDGIQIAHTVAWAIATIGMSAVFYQDPFGLITFDAGFEHMGAVTPRIGKRQVIHCLDAYETGKSMRDLKTAGSLSQTLGAVLGRPGLVPVISDFLFEDWGEVLRELTFVNTTHDVVLVLIDAAFAFEMPPVRSGWITVVDVETGRSRVVSRSSLRRMSERVRRWQDEVEQTARKLGFDVLRLGTDRTQREVALVGFVAERRLRRR
jgi:uncharacterized protein (DUF58 family)